VEDDSRDAAHMRQLARLPTRSEKQSEAKTTHLNMHDQTRTITF
jgi:hypothetical protein